MISIGDKFKTNEGYIVEVLEYKNAYNVLICFKEPVYISKIVQADKLRRGKISNPYHKSLYGVGFLGECDSREFKPYWSAMFRRCFSEAETSKSRFYLGVEIAVDWHNFSNFNSWAILQKFEEGWQLDKDILGNRKLYSPENCCFIPKEINQALILPRASLSDEHLVGMYYDARLNKYIAQARVGKTNSYIGCFETQEEAYIAYKSVKEPYIRSLAEKWKDKIDTKVYEKLIQFSVEKWLE